MTVFGPIPFRVLLDGEAPGPSHGVNVDEDGNGLLRDGRLYQLVRQHHTVHERRWRSRSSSPAPRRTCSRSGSQRRRNTRSTIDPMAMLLPRESMND
jgi:hypothetical protein